ncbi:MAG: hypothetical protein KC501_20590 [Myxococcales bacterium]|nr:hypothetical protein [Myxococcales bacterium]
MTSHHSVRVHCFAALVAVASAAVSVPAQAAPDSPTTSTDDVQPLRAELVIDTTALGDGGPSMRDVLAQLEKDVLRERGVEPAQSADDPRIVVVVRPLSEGASVFDNRVEVTIEQRGQLWSDASWGFDCARCSDGHLLSKVGVMLHSAITRLEEGSRDPVVVEPPEDKGSEDSPEPKVEPPIDDVPKPKPGPLVWAGAATALVGVAGIAVGVPLALREDRIIGDLDSPKRQGLQTRTPGWALTGIGAAALVTGGALLTVGLVRWHRAKNQGTRTGAATLTPWVTTERVGLGVHGRF